MKSTLLLFLSICFTGPLLAEDVFITDKLKAGLHEDKSLDSPIVKIVATGTRLEVVKKEDRLTYVRDADGSMGWINNDYLMAQAPTGANIGTMQNRADNLEKRLNESRETIITLEAELKNQGKVLPAETRELLDLKASHGELQQQFNAQKLENGELQVELTELRNRLGQDADTDALYKQIKSLQEDNKTLEIKLARTLEKFDADAASDSGLLSVSGDSFSPGMRNMSIYLLITLVIGLFAGAYLLDMINRRRHGGFRI
ncbi:MAG: TIGR04211 family SH3 domain-containing protein [Gammaproteobacteria bacterium]|nr:TIGR04211 family SH3 domain-containing protein [Gammaproteobacteria bacterium]